MSPLELTTSITALANVIASKIDDNDILSLLGAVMNQLGDTLATISTSRDLCNNITSNDNSVK